jgi:hypothetical protein
MSMDFTSRELALLMVAADSMSNMTTVPSEREDLIKLWERFREQIEHTVEHTVEHQSESSDPDQALKESIQDLAAQGCWTIESILGRWSTVGSKDELKHVMGTLWELEDQGIIALPEYHVEGFVRLA